MKKLICSLVLLSSLSLVSLACEHSKYTYRSTGLSDGGHIYRIHVRYDRDSNIVITRFTKLPDRAGKQDKAVLLTFHGNKVTDENGKQLTRFSSGENSYAFNMENGEVYPLQELPSGVKGGLLFFETKKNYFVINRRDRR